MMRSADDIRTPGQVFGMHRSPMRQGMASAVSKPARIGRKAASDSSSHLSIQRFRSSGHLTILYYKVPCNGYILEGAMQPLDNWVKQARKGLLEYVLLRCIAEQPMYAYEIAKRVERSGFDVTAGTVYPALSRLRAECWVAVDVEESKLGAPRKYYSITQLGKERLVVMTELLRPMVAGLETLLKGDIQ